MSEFVMYVLKNICCCGIFVLFYQYVLVSRCSFAFGRLYLLGTVLLSVIIPLLRIPLWPAGTIVASLATFPNEIAVSSETNEGIRNWGLVVLCGYAIVAGVIFGFCYPSLSGMRYVRRSAMVGSYDRWRIYESFTVATPFSFIRSIYLPSDLPPLDREQILCHESSHLRHGHSQERIIMCFFRSLLWFNPFVWIAEHCLSELHEFEADRDVLAAGYDTDGYCRLILKQLLGCNPDVICRINNSLTRKRFIMMKKSVNRERSLLWGTITVCVACGLILLLGCTSTGSKKSTSANGKSLDSTASALIKKASNELKIVRISMQKSDDADNSEKFEDPGKNRASAPAAEDSRPYLLVDGKEVKVFADIDPETIDHINVLKEDTAIKKYGEEARNGVIIVITKKI